MTSTTASWLTPRLPTLRAMAVGATTWPIALWIVWTFWPAMPAPAGQGDRLALALQLAVAPAVVLFVMNNACMRLFDADGAEDPFGNKESMKWRINARVLQNTIEQAAIFLPVLVGLSLRVAPEHMKIVPILTVLWCTGRVMFWVGYRVKIEWRSPGFDWTALTSFLGLAWFVSTLF